MKSTFRSLAVAAAQMLPAAVPAQQVINQNQPTRGTLLIQFDQPGLAQSFRQSWSNISGAGIFLDPSVGTGGGTVTISLYDNLPTASGNLLATGSASITGNNRWIDVFWSPLNITQGAPYYLVFSSTNSFYGISGDVNNPYGNGQLFANNYQTGQCYNQPGCPTDLGRPGPQFDSFATFDYSFRTYAVVPEPSTYALMGAGLLAMGIVARRRRQA